MQWTGMIAYCFASKKVIQNWKLHRKWKCRWTFIYTGFKPAWVMIKNTSATENWLLFDNKRDG